jgi:hypothetical protein
MPKYVDNRDPRVIWAEEERKKTRQKVINEAKAANPAYDGPETPEEEDAKSDWEHLKDVAKVKFPAHLAAKFNLTPEQRTFCVAHCLGWPQTKIALASGRNVKTVKRWLEEEVSVEFIAAFNFHIGQKDSKELIDREQYSAIDVLRTIRDDPTVSASTRADVAKWFYEQKHGKPKESREITGMNVRELTEQLMKLREERTRAIVPDFGEDDKYAEAKGLLPKMGSS